MKAPSTLNIVNYGASPASKGPWRTTTQYPLSGAIEVDAAGQTVLVVPAGKVGADCTAVDVRCDLAPGQELSIDLSTGRPVDYVPAAMPSDIVAHFGGRLRAVAGGPSQDVDITGVALEGMHVAATFAGRADLGPSAWLWIEGKLLFAPETDSVVKGEITVTACGTEPNFWLQQPIQLRLGDATIVVHGAGNDGIVLRGNQSIGVGQMFWSSFVCVWPRHLSDTAELGTVLAMASNSVCAVGIHRTMPEGAPMMPSNFDARAWVGRHWLDAWSQLHTMTDGALGPAAYSGQTGRQEVQLLHAGGEALQSGGAGAESVRLASAMHKHGKWPMHHREADGRHVDQVNHLAPRLVLDGGQVHWHHGVSPERLGRRNYIPGDAGIFTGPSQQHWYIGDLKSAAILTGSHGAQIALRDHAHCFLLSTTLNPSMSTYRPDGTRTWGCWATLVVDLWYSLDDRVLAQRVVDRFAAQVREVYAPMILANMSTDGLPIWSIRRNDPRVDPTGIGCWWWQEAFAAGAVYRFCRLFGVQEGIAPAIACARFVMDRAWHGDEWLGWRAQAQGPIDGSANDQNPPSYWNDFGHPMGIWAILRETPNDTKAKAIWQDMIRDDQETSKRWMLPLSLPSDDHDGS